MYGHAQVGKSEIERKWKLHIDGNKTTTVKEKKKNPFDCFINKWIPNGDKHGSMVKFSEWITFMKLKKQRKEMITKTTCWLPLLFPISPTVIICTVLLPNISFLDDQPYVSVHSSAQVTTNQNHSEHRKPAGEIQDCRPGIV